MTLTVRRSRALRSAAFALAFAALVWSTPVAQAMGKLVSVIVTSNSVGDAATATLEEGGRVEAPLPIVDGVLAKVPSSRLDELMRKAIVTSDRPMKVQSSTYGGSLVSAYPAEVGATSMWNDGVAGEGVTVALVDTGVANVPDLAGRVIASADLSPELTFEDGYGHGTFMAGLIAGNGASSGGRYTGVAPASKLMSVKVAASDGSTSLGRVLLGVQLVDESAERFNVRVALLALDSDSPLPPSLDPLTRSLRRLWAHGVVVVVPAGNHGPDAGTISSPGEDPVLLTAGSVDDLGTNDVADDVVSDFSSRGPTRWGMPKPDVAAPGHHLVSLRAPGSTVDEANPSARVEDAYFKGSGTSMSAAVTAGAAALLLQKRPSLSPDQVKAMFMGSAVPIPAGDVDSVGAGVVDVAAAAAGGAPEGLPAVPDDGVSFKFPNVGGFHFDWYGDDVNGYRFLAREWGAREWAARAWDARAWDAREWAAREWAQARWDAREWAARSWDAREWGAREWNAREWAAREWAARSWDARSWDAREWAARQWTARAWDAREWSARSWDAREWSARAWDAREWSAREWSAREWSAREWSVREWSAREWSAREWSARQWSARQWSATDWV